MQAATTPNRNMLFVSHATPDDNTFSKWIALKLASQGYPVWCDLTKLLGGEDFWKDIETAIRERTIKFLFVLSKNSNQKQGTLMELAVAKKVGKNINDFVIPLRIDDIRSDDVNIELNRLNFIDFSKDWIGGYRQLLKKLEEDAVPKDARFTPNAVSEWWRGSHPVTEGVQHQAERYCSNWYEFQSLPKSLWLHSIEPKGRFENATINFPLPAFRHDRYLLTFGAAYEIAEVLADHQLSIDNSTEIDFATFQSEGLQRPKIERREARNIITSLFKEGFDRFAASKGLLPYELANGAIYHWFKKDFAENDKVFFANPAGERGWRAMVGYKSVHSMVGLTRIRNWHFGIQAKVYSWPFSGFAIKPHVAFTENGVLYESKAKQHAARRSQCKSWYNDDWLDRIIAAMSFLADEKGVIQIPLSGQAEIVVSRIPMMFESPVTYQIVEEQPEMEEPENADPDEIEDEDMEEE